MEGSSDGSDRSRKRLRPSGGYLDLRSFQVATVIFDGTVSFCERFIDKRSRTIDQMTQAARSGRQNIGEGSRAAATSSRTELRLTNVARSSLDELLLDYEDHLRQRKKRQWGKDDREAIEVRAVAYKGLNEQEQLAAYSKWIESDDSEIVANSLICLIHQANYLLDRQIGSLEQGFIHDGGYTEQLAAARIAERQRQDESAGESTNPKCPTCGNMMVLRTARKGKRTGQQFWGCCKYPNCNGTRELH